MCRWFESSPGSHRLPRSAELAFFCSVGHHKGMAPQCSVACGRSPSRPKPPYFHTRGARVCESGRLAVGRQAQTSDFAHSELWRAHRRTFGCREVRTVAAGSTNRSKAIPTVRTNGPFVDPAGVPTDRKVRTVAAGSTFGVLTQPSECCLSGLGLVGAWICCPKACSVLDSSRTEGRFGRQEHAPTATPGASAPRVGRVTIPSGA